MQFTDIQVLYRTNPDFTGALLDHGKKAYEEVMKMEYAQDYVRSIARAC
jgi:hypothetical protein